MTALDLREDIGLEHESELYGALGSYWGGVHQDGPVFKLIADSVEELALQAKLNLAEAIKTSDLPDAPIFHRQVWYRFELRESALLTELDPQMAEYGGGHTFGDGLRYGQTSKL
jgi:hypothetical protein